MPTRLTTIRILPRIKASLSISASGGRSALAGKVLKDMGYTQVYNVGAFKDWAESGGAVEKPLDTRA
jgi:rhodanese-related sulfurtransferase